MAGLYVHIPFCSAKCAYCDFYSGPMATDRNRYIRDLGHELAMRADEPGASTPGTIYIGGGTPSLLTEEEFGQLGGILPVHDGVREFTIEVNPDDVSPARVRAWLQAGVNRVSMGIQSMDDAELSRVGRRHTAAQAISAFNVLREAGVDNISVDLIYGLPGQTIESWRRSVDMTLALGAEHLSAYSLSYEQGTRLYAALQAGHITEASEDLVTDMYNYLCDRARAAGYEHYEISNFARPGKRAVHNSSYWSFAPYVGLGPGAHSFDGHVRRYNPWSIKGYMEAIEGGKTFYEIDEESDTDRINDRIMVALRTADGLDLSTLPAPVRQTLLARASSLRGLQITGERIIIPESDFLISDSLIRELLI